MQAPDQVFTHPNYNFGQYTSPFKNVNLNEVRMSGPLPFGHTFFLREWQAFQIFTEGYFGIMAIYNTKKVSLVQLILYDIENQKKYKFEKKVLPWQLEIPNGLYKTRASYSSSNCNMLVEHDVENSLLDIDVTIASSRKYPGAELKLKGHHDTQRYTPIVVCLPFNEKRAMYSHKCLMPLEGTIKLGHHIIELSQKNSHLIIDDHKGYYPYITKYDWITAAGFNEQGQRIGFNFTDNQIQNKEKFNENGVWVDGQLSFLPPIKVSRPKGYQETWYVKDKGGQVELSFKPIEHNAVNLNLLLLKSKYQGPYGYFNGVIHPKGKDKIIIDNFFGMGEDFYLRS